jgi:hypothetical protein
VKTENTARNGDFCAPLLGQVMKAARSRARLVRLFGAQAVYMI